MAGDLVDAREELLAKFQGYIQDAATAPPEDQPQKFRAILTRFATGAVQIAASQLVPTDVDLAKDSDIELAERMQRHVTFRDGARLPNSAWHMMLEAAKRLRESTARLSTIEADAARYQWLRERDLETISRGGVFAGMTPKNVILNGDDLDKAIDDARSLAAAGKGGG